MQRRLAVPTVVTCRENREAADGALTALLVAIEEIDREHAALVERAHEGGAQWIVGITERALPVATIAR